MITKIGIGTLVAGLCIGLLSGISSFMMTETKWTGITISKIIGYNTSESIIEFTSIEAVQNFLDFVIYDMPLSGFLVVVGIIFLIISLFVKDH